MNTVAVVKIQEDYDAAYKSAVSLVGGLKELNSPDRDVTIKIGIFDPRAHHHTSILALKAIISAFDQAPHVYLAESDNYCGKALDRLERFKELFTDRVLPLSLSDDAQARTLPIAGQEMQVSSALLKPNIFVSTHVLRSFPRGSILKNLFGCTPMVKKSPFHKNEVYPNLVADLFEAAGGIDLAVMDGTNLYFNASEKHMAMGILLVGKDAVAVETVGALLAGLKPEKMPVIQEFVRRGLGEADIHKIEIAGVSNEEFEQLLCAHKGLKKVLKAEPRKPGISDTIDRLVSEGWMDSFRCVPEVVDELQKRGISNAVKTTVETTLKRRVGKTLEKSKEGPDWMYRRSKG